MALFLLMGVFGQLISNIVGMVYPAYFSVKAVEGRDSLKTTRWTTYWIIFGCMTLLDTFSDVIEYILPFYWLAQVGPSLVLCPHGAERLKNGLRERHPALLHDPEQEDPPQCHQRGRAGRNKGGRHPGGDRHPGVGGVCRQRCASHVRSDHSRENCHIREVRAGEP